MFQFLSLFSKSFPIIGMIHVGALPGTPLYRGNFNKIIEHVRTEAKIYQECGVDGVMIENMHDIPYLRPKDGIGPEVTAAMTRLCTAVQDVIADMPCGVQVLAGGNREALAIAKACNLQFIRAEGFVFGHVADEGYTDACAGSLLRYRRHIDAEHVLILTDIKKKHSSHAITGDVSIFETAHAAEFFLSDGLVVTGSATGVSADLSDLESVYGKVSLPIVIGSGLTVENLARYWKLAHGAIVGSHFKANGRWNAKLSEAQIHAFMQSVETLRHDSKK